MRLIGICIILTGIVGAWLLVTTEGSEAEIIVLSLITVFTGFFFIIQERITEVAVKGVGTIKAVTEQVTLDAQAISDVKERVDMQSATINLIAKEASSAKTLSNELAYKNQQAEEKLEIINDAIKKANLVLSELEVKSTMRIPVQDADGKTIYLEPELPPDNKQ